MWEGVYYMFIVMMGLGLTFLQFLPPRLDDVRMMFPVMDQPETQRLDALLAGIQLVQLLDESTFGKGGHCGKSLMYSSGQTSTLCGMKHPIIV